MPRLQQQSAGKLELSTLTSELAYILGVFLGDGCVCFSGGNYYFSLNAIDEEFVRKTATYLEKVLGKKNAVFLDKWGIRRGRKPLWKIVAYSKEFATWLNQTTHYKKKIPSIIKKASKSLQRHFILGLMDSESYVSETWVRNGDHMILRWRMGYCSADDWIGDFAHMLEKHGIRVGPLRKEEKVKPFHKQRLKFNINPESYANSEIGFSIKRKQDKLNNYINKVLTPQRLHA